MVFRNATRPSHILACAFHRAIPIPSDIPFNPRRLQLRLPCLPRPLQYPLNAHVHVLLLHPVRLVHQLVEPPLQNQQQPRRQRRIRWLEARAHLERRKLLVLCINLVEEFLGGLERRDLESSPTLVSLKRFENQAQKPPVWPRPGKASSTKGHRNARYGEGRKIQMDWTETEQQKGYDTKGIEPPRCC